MKSTGLTSKQARLMAALGKALDAAVPKGSTVGGKRHTEGHVDQVLGDPRFAELRDRTKQWYRRLRIAARVCGVNLKSHLKAYGPSVVLLVAKFKKGAAILAAGKVTTAAGERAALAPRTNGARGKVLRQITIRELEDLLVAGKRRPRLDKPRKPVAARPFRVPEDLQVIGRILYLNLKTLRPRPGARPRPRYVTGDLAEADRRRLEQLLNIYGLLLKKAASDREARGRHRVKNRELVDLDDEELVPLLDQIARNRRPGVIVQSKRQVS